MFNPRSRIVIFCIGLFLVASTVALSSVGIAAVFKEWDMPGGANCWAGGSEIPPNEINTLTEFGLPDPFNANASQYAVTAKDYERSNNTNPIQIVHGGSLGGDLYIRMYFYLPAGYHGQSSCGADGLKWINAITADGVGARIKLFGNPPSLGFKSNNDSKCHTIVTSVSPGWHYVEFHLNISNNKLEAWLDVDSSQTPTATQFVNWFSAGDTFKDVHFNKNWSGGFPLITEKYYIKGVVVSNAKVGDTFGLLSFVPSSPPSDVTAPTVPQNVRSTYISASQINLRWDPSSDPESGVDHYNIYRDAVKVGESVTTSDFYDIGLTDNTTFVYTVSAVNRQNLESGESTTINVSTDPATPPFKSAECDMPGGANCWQLIENNEIKTLSQFGLPDPFNASASDYAITLKISTTTGREQVWLKSGDLTNEIWHRMYFLIPSGYPVNSSCASAGLKFMTHSSNLNRNGRLKLFGTTNDYKLTFKTSGSGCKWPLATSITPNVWHYVEMHMKVQAGNDFVELWFDSDAATNAPTVTITDTDFWGATDFWTQAKYNINFSGASTPGNGEAYLKGDKLVTNCPMGDTLGLLSGAPPPSDTTSPAAPTNLTAN